MPAVQQGVAQEEAAFVCFEVQVAKVPKLSIISAISAIQGLAVKGVLLWRSLKAPREFKPKFAENGSISSIYTH